MILKHCTVNFFNAIYRGANIKNLDIIKDNNTEKLMNEEQYW